MKETKKERFIRVVTARMKSVSKGLRLIGDCSNIDAFEYTKDQIEELFNALQVELDKAKSRYIETRTFFLTPQRLEYLNVIIPVSEDKFLRAVAVLDDNFPAIEIELLENGKPNRKLCFAEGNAELGIGEIGVGIYNKNDDNTRYYTVFDNPLADIAKEGKCVKLEWGTVACLLERKISEILQKEIECEAHLDASDYWTVAFKDYRMPVDEIKKLSNLFPLADEDRAASMPEEGKTDVASVDMSLAERLLQLAIDHSWEAILATEEGLYLINLKRMLD